MWRFFSQVSRPSQYSTPLRGYSARARENLFQKNAHDLAILNMAISDAAVATFETKYYYKFWRPVTAIHEAAFDGNDRTEPDATFQPLIETPCFPSYPSAHGVLSNSASSAMERIYGNVSFSITLSTPAV